MILGLPWEAWLLLLLAIGAGPALVVPFYLNHRRGRADKANGSGAGE
jgi:hypothetical protein